MKGLHDLELVIESLEEVRAIQLFARLGFRLDQPMFQWIMAEGLKRLEANFGAQKSTAEPQNVLKHIKATPQAGDYLLLDFHPYLDDPVHVRLIKEIAQDYHIVSRTLIMLSHAIDIPAEIRHLTARFTLQMPGHAGIRKLIAELSPSCLYREINLY